MFVERRGKKWVVRLVIGKSKHTVAVCGSDNAARVCLAQHRAAIADGTSPYLVPGALSIESYANEIGVRKGTVKRWIHEGMPVTRVGRVVLIIPELANAWVREHRKDTIAKNRRSVVYFVERETDHAIKIGWSSDVARRIGELRKKEQCEIVLLAAIPGDKPEEQAVHARFANDAIADEWFRPSESLTTFISKLGQVA